MTKEEYKSINWNRGNVVRLTNGKEYSVRGTRGKCLILYSEEYKKHFVADNRIIDCRVSDNVEPFVKKEHPVEQPKKKKEQPSAAQQAQQAPAPKAAAADPAGDPAQAPVKKKRKRIVISRSERVQY